MFAAKVARFVIFVEFFYLVEREMGELCVVAGQVQSGGSQPVLSSSAPASRSDSTDLEVRWWGLRGEGGRGDCREEYTQSWVL